jgi:hypothetical protein
VRDNIGTKGIPFNKVNSSRHLEFTRNQVEFAVERQPYPVKIYSFPTKGAVASDFMDTDCIPVTRRIIKVSRMLCIPDINTKLTSHLTPPIIKRLPVTVFYREGFHQP